MKTQFTEEWCYQTLRRMRWPDGIVCPFCRTKRITTHTKAFETPRRRYICLRCRRTFSDLTGTPFARTNIHLVQWFRCLRLKDNGSSTAKVAKELGVKWDTASRMLRRLDNPGLAASLLRAAKEEPV